jgi:hypothetical protein
MEYVLVLYVVGVFYNLFLAGLWTDDDYRGALLPAFLWPLLLPMLVGRTIRRAHPDKAAGRRKK